MPKPEWKDDPNKIPTGRIVKIEPFGKDGAIHVEGERRAFAGYVFEYANDWCPHCGCGNDLFGYGHLPSCKNSVTKG